MASFDSPRLRTERLLLRPLGDADAAALLVIFSDPRAMRYWSTPPWAGIEQARAFIERSRDAMHRGEALRALLDHGFGALQLNRIEADIDPRNAASACSLERLGFTREGLLRERWIVDGEVSDTSLYGLLARQWRAGPAHDAGP